MNILYTVFSFNIGGIERLLVDITKNWDVEKDNIHVCIINNDYNLEILDSLKDVKKVNLKLLERKKNDRVNSIIKYQKEYFKYIKENNIDVIHCQSISALKFTIPYKVLNKKVKLFHTVHATNTYKNYDKIEVLIDKIFTRKIIAISSSVKNEILSQRIREEKIEVVYNGIDFNKFNKLNKFKNIKIKERIKIGCVARLDYHTKGQDILIKAVAQLKDKFSNIECYLAGECNKWQMEQKQELIDLADNLNVKDNIIFVGNVENISEFLEDIDIFVLPSRYEGFGIALIEAIASRIPVIASNIDGPKEILEDGKYGLLFEKGDYNQLAVKIESLIKNNKTNEIIEKAYNNALNKYDIKIMVKILREIYEK